jgi:uncharacterized protein (UPF0276 family)
VGGTNLHDLLPLPYTEESLNHLVPRIQKVQDHLGRRLLLENVSSYLTFSHSELTEWDFIAELCKRTDCGILLDINNIYVSSVNHRFDPSRFINAIPIENVGQFHLAGHSVKEKFLLDSHDGPVSEPVWDLFRQAVKRFGKISTLIEWDANIPDFATLEKQAVLASQILEQDTSQ